MIINTQDTNYSIGGMINNTQDNNYFIRGILINNWNTYYSDEVTGVLSVNYNPYHGVISASAYQPMKQRHKK